MIDMQAEIFSTLAQINRDWFDRAKSEARLASELFAKLTAAHSVPDVKAAYQEWHSQRMQMFADDRRRFFSKSQKFMELGLRFLGNGNPGATR
jgi:hypothetical protein